jgi:hypothetical protein
MSATHVARYPDALVPLARLNVPQLQCRRSGWRVDAGLSRGSLSSGSLCAGGDRRG